jgi:hypothetical protein
MAKQTKLQKLQSEWRMKYGRLLANRNHLLREGVLNLTTNEYSQLRDLCNKVIVETNAKYRAQGLKIAKKKYT